MLFFTGVYLGKFAVLYLYGKFSTLLKNKVANITSAVDKVTGVLLVIIAVAQMIKLIVV